MESTTQGQHVNRLAMAACLSIVLSLAVSARTLHVATTGSDSANGSAMAPWRTIQRALNEALPGDIVSIAGGVYSEYVESVRDGNGDDPIVVAAVPGSIVQIDGTDVDWSTGLRLTHDFVHIEGLTICNWASTGIWIGGAGHVELRDCHIHDCVFGIGAGDGAHDFLFERVEISHFDLYGFDASPSGGADCTNGTLIDCVAHSARDREQNVDGFALGHGGQHTFRFVRCEAYDVFDGFDISARDTVLEACQSRENGNAGFKIWADNVRLENCVAFANAICNVELDWDGEPGTTLLNHCTFFDADVYSIWVENARDRLVMTNCIIAGGDNIGLAFEQADASNYTGDFNLFHNDNPARAISVGYVDEFSIAQLAAGAWSAMSQQDASSLAVTDASTIFVAAQQGNLSLTANSPAIDAASVQGIPPADIEGRPRVQGRAPDIGAWEY